MEQLNEIAKNILDLQAAIKSMPTTEKVEQLAGEVAKLSAIKNAQPKPCKIFGTEESRDIVAGHFGKALIDSGMLGKGGDSYGAKFFAQKAANLNSTDSGQGPTMYPTAVDPEVSKLVNEYGVGRRYASVVNNLRGSLTINKRNVRVTVEGQSRPDATITPAGTTYTSVTLAPKTVSAITKVEEKLMWDSPIDVLNEAMSDLAEGAAEIEDASLFVGTGAAAYLGFTGLKTASGLGVVSPQSDEFDLDDVLNLRAEVHASVTSSRNARFFAHPYQIAWLSTQKASSSGVYHFNPASLQFVLGGSEIVPVAVMDDDQDQDMVPWIFGDMAKAVRMGFARPISLRILPELYAAENSVGVQITYDVGLALRQADALARVRIIGASS